MHCSSGVLRIVPECKKGRLAVCSSGAYFLPGLATVWEKKKLNSYRKERKIGLLENRLAAI